MANFIQNQHNLPSMDYIVEQGSNYRRWNSGVQECWEKFPTSTTSYTSQSITGGYSMYRVWTFPRAFIDSNVHVFVSGDSSGWALDSTGTWGETSTNCHVALMSTSQISQVRLQAYAIGRWK